MEFVDKKRQNGDAEILLMDRRDGRASCFKPSTLDRSAKIIKQKGVGQPSKDSRIRKAPYRTSRKTLLRCFRKSKDGNPKEKNQELEILATRTRWWGPVVVKPSGRVLSSGWRRVTRSKVAVAEARACRCFMVDIGPFPRASTDTLRSPHAGDEVLRRVLYGIA